MKSKTTTPLALISGWAHGAGVWQPMLAALGTGWMVRLIGMPELTSAGSAPDDMAQALARRLEAFPAPPILAAWSAGALAAIAAAAARPDLARGLVLLAGTAQFCHTPDYPWGQPLGSLQSLRRRLQRNARTALADFLDLTYAPAGLAMAERDVLIDAALASGRPALLAGLDFLERTDLRPVLPNVIIPVLLLHGRRDLVIPWQASEYLARRLPAAELDLLDTGHALPSHAPAAIAEAIRKLQP